MTTPLQASQLNCFFDSPISLRISWAKKLLEKAGLPDIRFHDLRHSSATMLLIMGVHPKIVQEILGHSDISMTLNIYSHVLPTIQESAIDKLNQAFAKQEGDYKQENEHEPSKDRDSESQS